MPVDLARALEDWEYFESIVEVDDPTVTLLKRAGAFGPPRLRSALDSTELV